MALAVDLLGNLPRIRRPAGRRIFPFVFAVLLITTLLLVHAPETWLPFSVMNRSDSEQYVPTGNMTFAWPMAPEEWDWPEIETALADGVCRFVSPLEGLTEEERILAATMEFEETTPGVVRAKGEGHPILGLLHRGEERWRQKVASQSMSLKEAADKYRQKWNRPPPKGFDKWSVLVSTRYAASAHVWQARVREIEGRSPDRRVRRVSHTISNSWTELMRFFRVMRNILPFYGLEMSSMQDRLDEVEALDRITVFAVENGVLRVTNPDSLSLWPEMESGKLYSVLQPIQHLLPDVTCVFELYRANHRKRLTQRPGSRSIRPISPASFSTHPSETRSVGLLSTAKVRRHTKPIDRYRAVTDGGSGGNRGPGPAPCDFPRKRLRSSARGFRGAAKP